MFSHFFKYILNMIGVESQISDTVQVKNRNYKLSDFINTMLVY